MPTYTFLNKTTGEETTEFMKISELDKFIVDHPELSCLPSAPLISYNDLKKPSDGFRDRLREIKASHRGSTINTF